MKRLLLLIVLFLLFGSFCFAMDGFDFGFSGNDAGAVLLADNGKTTSPDAAVRKNSFGINVLYGVASIFLLQAVTIPIEYQRALAPWFALEISPELVFGTGVWGVGVGLGANFYPMGQYLHGFFISIMPMGGVISALGYVFPVYGAYLRAGFEWVFKSGFVLSLGGGGQWNNYTGIAPNLVLTLGYAW